MTDQEQALLSKVNKDLFELSPEIVAVVNVKGFIVAVNRRVEEVSGFSRDEVVGKHFTQLPFFTPSSTVTAATKFAQRLIGKNMSPYQVSMKTKRGDELVVKVADQVLKDERGDMLGVVVMLSEVTAYEKNNRELSARVAEIKRYFDIAQVMLVALDTHGKVRAVNLTAQKVLGFTEEELVGRDWFSRVIPKEIEADVRHVFKQIMQGAEKVHEEYENQVVTKTGRKRLIHWNNSLLTNPDGSVAGTLSSGRDVTEQQQTKAALAANVGLLQTLFEQMHEGYTLCRMEFDTHGRPTDWVYEAVNAAFETITGLTGVVGKRVSEVLPELRTTNPELFDTYGRVVTTGKAEKFEVKVESLRLWLEITAFRVSSNQFVAVFEDISERKKADVVMEEHKKRLELAMDTAQLAEWEYDVATDTFTFNDRFYTLFGTVAEIEGGYQMKSEVYARKFVYPDDAALVGEEIAKVLATNNPDYFRSIDHRIRRADGAVRHITVRFGVVIENGKVVKTRGVNQDITERKEAELQVYHRDAIMSAFMMVADRFLRVNPTNWEETVLSVFGGLASALHVFRVYAVKQTNPDDLQSKAYLRFEFLSPDQRKAFGLDPERLVDLSAERMDPWLVHLKQNEVVCTRRRNWPGGHELIWNVRPDMKTLLLLPVFVGQQWWGYIGIEDSVDRAYSNPELEALKAIAVAFGAAIVRKRLDEKILSLQLGIERSHEVVFITDPNGGFEYVNPAFTQLYGYRLEELAGKTPRVLKSGKQSPQFYLDFWQRLKRGEVITVDLANLTRDRKEVVVHVSVNPITGKHNEILGFLAIQRDVTAERSAQAELYARTEELEKMNKLMVGRELKMAQLKRQLAVNKVTTGDPEKQLEEPKSALTVAEVMSHPVVTIGETESVLAAARLMAQKAVGALIVVTKSGDWGMITERDFLNFIAKAREHAAATTTVGAVMSQPVITVTAETTVEAASALLRDKNIRRLPVVDGKRLLGIVTQTTLILALREQVIGDLKEKMGELDRLNKLMVGREVRMAELRKQIKGGQPEL